MIAEGTLLAKSPPKRGEPLMLAQHLLDTELAADLIFRDGSRWLAAFLRFFRIAPADAARFREHVRVAGLAHDIGKANADFQRAVRTPGTRQTLRHEHLSTLFLHHPRVAEWFRQHDLDHDAVCAAVLSHHLKAAPDGDHKFCQPRSAADLRLFFDDTQIGTALERMGRIVAAPPPQPGVLAPRFLAPEWQASCRSVLAAARKFGRDEGDRRRLALALKAGVIAADSVASAMVREGLSISEWIHEVAHAPSLTANDVREDLLAPRIRQIEIKSSKPFVPHRFQDGTAQLPRRALLLAGCGSGKTLAAWRWAERQLESQPAGRVVFLYPTRGTATEGFRDYVGWAPEGSAVLLHGTARYELEALKANPPESLHGKELVDESEARLFALGLWPKRYFSATVDQFLSFLEHRYESLCLLPALADALVILDEIHSYDPKMFANLLAFLDHFDVPVLAMTATLPPSRLEQLEERGLRVYPQPADRVELADLEAAERHPRYRVEPCGGEDDAYRSVIEAYRKDLRVLWVVNVVRRCQRLAQRLATDLGVALGESVLVYHSRFKLEDRRLAHERTVDAFQGATRPVIAVTTQVCEMSLDLDADVLVSEDAPIPSLVQRCGRANRHKRRGDDFRAALRFYPPASHAPYDREELEAARNFVAALPAEPSQRDMAGLLEAHAISERRPASELSRFLNGGYFALPGDFRDTDDFGHRCVLDTEIDHVRARLDARQPIDGYVLTVPKKWARDPDPSIGLPRWLRVAPAEHYSAMLGFQDPGGPG